MFCLKLRSSSGRVDIKLPDRFNHCNFFNLETLEGIAVIVVGNIIASKFGNLSILSGNSVISIKPNAIWLTFSFKGVPLSIHSVYSSVLHLSIYIYI